MGRTFTSQNEIFVITVNIENKHKDKILTVWTLTLQKKQKIKERSSY